MPDGTSITAGSPGILDLDPLRTAREASRKTRENLDSLLSNKIGKYVSEDTSLVVFGSLARGEWTSQSDLDWTYLIDGGANSDHLRISQEIQSILKTRNTRTRDRPASSETWLSAMTSFTKS